MNACDKSSRLFNLTEPYEENLSLKTDEGKKRKRGNFEILQKCTCVKKFGDF